MRKSIFFADDLRRRVRGYIFRPWRKHPKTGEILWARDYGLRAWKIPVYY